LGLATDKKNPSCELRRRDFFVKLCIYYWAFIIPPGAPAAAGLGPPSVAAGGGGGAFSSGGVGWHPVLTKPITTISNKNKAERFIDNYLSFNQTIKNPLETLEISRGEEN
jgi:hypothetical protein